MPRPFRRAWPTTSCAGRAGWLPAVTACLLLAASQAALGDDPPTGTGDDAGVPNAPAETKGRKKDKGPAAPPPAPTPAPQVSGLADDAACQARDFDACRRLVAAWSGDPSRQDLAVQTLRWGCDEGDADTCWDLARRLAGQESAQHEASDALVRACTLGRGEACLAAADAPLATETPLMLGKLLVTGCEAGTEAACQRLETLGWRSDLVVRAHILGERAAPLVAAAFLPGSTTLLLGEHNRLSAVDASTGRPVAQPLKVSGLRPFLTGVYGLRWLGAGPGGVLAGVASGNLLWTPTRAEHPSSQLVEEDLLFGDRFALRGDGHMLVTTAKAPSGRVFGYDLLRAWRVPEGDPLGTVVPVGGAVSALAWAGDDSALAVGLQGGRTVILDGLLHRVIHTLVGPTEPVTRVALDTASGFALTLDRGGQLNRWPLDGLPPEPAPVSTDAASFAMRPDGSLVAVIHDDRIEFLDPTTGKALAPPFQAQSVRGSGPPASFSADGRFLFVGGLGNGYQSAAIELSGARRTDAPPVEVATWLASLAPIPEDAMATPTTPAAGARSGKLIGQNGHITGRVLSNSAPVRAATVVARTFTDAPAPGIPSQTYETVTDAQGRYELEGLMETVWEVEVVVPGTGLIRRTVSLVDSPIWAGEVAELRETPLLTGRVTLPGGQPALEAVVTIRSQGGFLRGWVREDGSYVAPTFGPGTYRVDIRHRGGATLSRMIDIPKGNLNRRDFSLKGQDDPDVLRVRVVTDTGEPVRGAHVNSGAPVVLTDAEGRWWSEDMGESRNLEVSWDGREWAGINVQKPFPLEVVVTIPTASLSVRHEVWRDAAPIVVVRGDEGVLATPEPYADGTRFARLTAGVWTVATHFPDHRTASARVEVGAGAQLVVDAPSAEGTSVTGRLVDATTGRPLVYARIEAACFDVPDTASALHPTEVVTHSGPLGGFHVDRLAPGRRVLRVFVAEGSGPPDETAGPTRLVLVDVPDSGVLELGDVKVYPRSAGRGWPGLTIQPGAGGARVTWLADRRLFGGRVTVGDRVLSIGGRSTDGLDEAAIQALLDEDVAPNIVVAPQRGGQSFELTLPRRPGAGD